MKNAKLEVIAVLSCLLLLVGVLPIAAFAAEEEDIVILYENDVHCAIEGYSKLAALKKELQETYTHVGVVSGGDYIQGNSLGAISQGEYIVELMNLVGYDAVTLGNHEYDFRLSRLEELVALMNKKPVCSNFQKIDEDSSYFQPYTIVSYGDVKIAYIGITTPATISSSYPAQFKDEDGSYIYTFNHSTLYEVVQKNIDAAKADGADYIIAISHIGFAEDEIYGDLEDIEVLIENTEGLDVVLDAHSHSVIEGMKLTDKAGNEVLLSSTGTKFAYIGKLTISEDGFETCLIPTETYTKTDPAVDAHIEKIYQEYSVLGERKVGVSEVDLIMKDEEGNRLVRVSETNLGNLCADAVRYAVDADIGYVNGGGIRADIPAGDVTFNNLLNVFPYNNNIVLAEVSGQIIKDMMETAMAVWPEENGPFPHVSGITFSVNTTIPSSVEFNEYEEFVGVSGEYRVYDIKVFNKKSGEYEPIDLDGTYTLAAFSYQLLEYGSGMTMLKDAKILQNEGILDVEALEQYIAEELGGVIGEDYAETNVHIAFMQGENDFPQTGDGLGPVLWYAFAISAVSFVLLPKKGRICAN